MKKLRDYAYEKALEIMKGVMILEMDININRMDGAIQCQRVVDERWVNYIYDHWDPNVVAPLCINIIPGGIYRLVDGQHTKAAYKKRLDNGLENSALMKCRYGYNLTKEQENAWLLVEAEKRNPQPNSTIIKASLAIGNPILNSKKDIVEKYGYTVPYSNSRGIKISCVESLINIDDTVLDRTMKILSTAYPQNKKAVQSKFIKGVAKFIEVYDSFVDDNRLTDKLSSTSPESILSSSSTVRTSSDLKIPSILFEIYNKGLRKNKLDALKLLSH